MTHRPEIEALAEKVFKGQGLSREEALVLSEIKGSGLASLFASAVGIREYFRGNRAEVCSIINAKSGACSEDCAFCAQSARSRAEIPVYPLLSRESLIPKAEEIKKYGITRCSLVTSGRKISKSDLRRITGMITAIRNLGISPCASLGLLNKSELSQLRDAGLERYHHNLETSVRFFPEICSTHTYWDKIQTIEAAKSAGLSLCAGGIFGMGETWEDRVDMALALKRLDVDSVPVNFLIPLPGTGFSGRKLLHPLEALKIISIYRFLLPEKQIRICGGRLQVLGEFHSMIFFAGADGMITGNYLTTLGRNPGDDFRLIERSGLVAC
ncbi:MAG: biotin synthase BioB [Nitrospirota bacterium]